MNIVILLIMIRNWKKNLIFIKQNYASHTYKETVHYLKNANMHMEIMNYSIIYQEIIKPVYALTFKQVNVII